MQERALITLFEKKSVRLTWLGFARRFGAHKVATSAGRGEGRSSRSFLELDCARLHES